MSLLQLQIDDRLKKSLQEKSDLYGVPVSSLVRIVLVDSFVLNDEESAGNIFNAQRDNDGKGVSGRDFLKCLRNAG